MSGHLEFWFDFGSPYAYFASHSVEEVAAECGLEVVWRPFLLGFVFKVTGMKPLVDQPLRGSYARHDWARIARQLNVPFCDLARPPAAVVPSRAFYWLEVNEPAKAIPFAKAAFHAYFGEGRATVAPEDVLRISMRLGADCDQLQHVLEGSALKYRLREVTDEAIDRGIFGSPFFLVGDEPFWGFDRLPMLREWVSRSGW